MKRLFLLFLGAFFICCGAYAQSSNTTATVTYVLGMGGNAVPDTTVSMLVTTVPAQVSTNAGPCGTVRKNGVTTVYAPCAAAYNDTTYPTNISCVVTNGFMSMKYNYTTNTLTNFPTNTTCTPSYTGPYLNGVSTAIYSSMIAYDPANQYEYYFAINDSNVHGVNVPNTYVYAWPVGTCPANLWPIADFQGQYLMGKFDNNGLLWAIGNSANSPYTLNIQKITLTSPTTFSAGAIIPLNTGSAPNITNLDGEMVITPTGSMYLVYNNEEFAIAYQNYASNPASITATYVGTIAVPANGDYLVGMAFAGGSMVATISNNQAFSCSNTPIYEQLSMLTGASSRTAYAGGFNSNDNTSITSGIGSSKYLVSVTPTGTSGQYTVVYDVYVQDYGNYPTANVQVTDNLGNINHSQNVVSVSTAWTGTTPPASYNLNLDPNFNGTDSLNLLQPGGSLPNYPVASANFTIQVTVVLNNITPGVIYDNTAVVTGTGFSGDVLTDTSTNGTNPNPDGDGRPDDAGEDVPTPFIVELTAQSAPCPTLPTVLYTDDFSSGSGLSTTDSLSTWTTQYTGTTTTNIPINDYTIADNADLASSANYINLTDHTGNSKGRMMIVNANNLQNTVYQTSVTGVCANLLYSFNAYAANIEDTTAIQFCQATLGYQPPNLEFQLTDPGTGLVLADLSTGPILTHSWTSYGMRIALPPADVDGLVNLQIVNVGGGSCGNAFALDDISFGLCNAEPTVVINGGHAGCIDSSTTMIALLSDSSVFGSTPVDFQWQDSTAGAPGWTNIANGNSAVYTIPVVTLATPTYYRVSVFPSGQFGTPCSYTSPSYYMALKYPSTSTVGTVTANPTTIGCSGGTVTLTASGYTLGTGAGYVWSTGGCGSTGGTEIDSTTTNTITVDPTLSTTYYVEVSGACNATPCATVMITDACTLPTDLLYFDGSYSTGITTLSWEVTDNQDVTGFTIERSVDGVNFTAIDSMTSTNGVGLVTYTYPDNVSNVDASTITYRLILHMKGGAESESAVVAVNKPLSNVTGVVMYPNPAANQLTIAITSDQQQQMSYSIISMLGQILLSGNQALDRGANSVNVSDVQILPSGAYIVRIQLQNGVIEKKLIIQK